jgi:hypothetical protein
MEKPLKTLLERLEELKKSLDNRAYVPGEYGLGLEVCQEDISIELKEILDEFKLHKNG